MTAGKIVLVQWDEPEGRRRAEQLEAEGWQVLLESEDGGRAYKVIRAERPDAVVVDLARRPSHGREVGRSLRQTRATRDLPMVFVDGDADARAQVAAQVSGAVFAASAELGAILAQFARPDDAGTSS
jgi:CheY-like chemotaxis protein